MAEGYWVDPFNAQKVSKCGKGRWVISQVNRSFPTGTADLRTAYFKKMRSISPVPCSRIVLITIRAGHVDKARPIRRRLRALQMRAQD